MNDSAFLMMVSTLSIISLVTGYFFYRVLTSPQRPEEDSYSDNDVVEETEE